MRKFFKWVVGILIALLVLTGIAVLIVVLTIDKEWIEARLQKDLSRRVMIGKLKTRIFSPISGFQVEDLKISNRLSHQELARMGEIPGDRLFIQARLGTMKFSLLPLLQRKLEIKEITLHKPFLHIMRYRDGSYNFSDLTDDEESFFRQVSISALTIEDGRLAFTDMGTKNRFTLNDFSLNSKKPGRAIGKAQQEQLDVTSTFIFKARQLRSASFARSVDIDFRINGTVQSLVIPDSPALIFNLTIQTLAGTIQGFKIMEKINSLPAVREYLGGLNFLSKNFTWKKGSVHIGFDGKTIHVSHGEIRALKHSLQYDGQFWPHSGLMSLKAQLLLPATYKETIRNHLLTKINQVIPARMKRSINQAELVDRLIAPIINQKGEVILVFALRGTPGRPDVTLVRPRLKQFSRVLLDLIREKVSSQGKSLLDRLMDKVLKKNVGPESEDLR